jgi:CubicO group peptidase (beta-lactamase class C family)
MRLLLLLATLALCSGQEGIPVRSRAIDWPQSKPESQGVDSAWLEKASGYLIQNKPASASLLIARRGAIVFERYYGGATRDDAFNVKSINKSVLSALTGIAIAEGRIRSVEDRVADYIPEAFAGLADARARDIRVRHLLTMTAGLYWVENGNITRDWIASSDPNRFALSQPFAAPPGEKFEYSTALTHLLSTLIARATGRSTLDYANARLFQPLGIACARWDQLHGVHFGGAELYLTSRDLARFGQLYLRKGRWGERQLVPAGWIADSTSPKAKSFYGDLWWLHNPGGHRMICAQGIFGQYLCLVPELDLLIVHTARPAFGRNANELPLDMIPRFVLPAIRND